MGQQGKSFCFPVLLELSSITGRETRAFGFCEGNVRATPVSATFFKSRSQKLKMQPFAKK
jgi:hypothetical protein